MALPAAAPAVRSAVAVRLGRQWSLRRSLGVWGHVGAAVAVALITLAIVLLPGASHLSNISMLYLLGVMGTALRYGRRAAVTASLLSFLAFDWFFTEPRYTLTVKDPSEWLALCVFLVTAVVVGHLMSLLRARADDARRREREAAALANASWAVASHIERGAALAEVLKRAAEIVDLMNAVILGPRSSACESPVLAALHVGAPLPGPLPDTEATLPDDWPIAEAGSAGVASASHRVTVPLRTEARRLGLLVLWLTVSCRPTPEERRAIVSLANHAAVVLERERLAQAETHARALEEADRLKTALLSMVSHDFRSPLASIKTSASVLLHEGKPVDDVTHRELLTGIEQEADRLNRVVGNLLALSRLEADAWRPQCEPTDPAELIGASLSGFNAEQNRRIRVELSRALDEAWLDPVQISQVLHNLVDNALKYSPTDQPVVVSATSRGERFVVQVTDSGPGLEPGGEEQVFQRFYRAPSFRESSLPGVGIGLAVCRGLVEAHHGSLTAANCSEGGAVFTLELPMQAAPTTAGDSG